jgi:hypothetical protein
LKGLSNIAVAATAVDSVAVFLFELLDLGQKTEKRMMSSHSNFFGEESEIHRR